MTRVGLLGLEPFLVSQVEELQRDIEVVLLDAVDDEARDALELDVVLVSSEHPGAGRVIGSHPRPPVVVVEDGAGTPQDEVPGEPVRVRRPMSSRDLLTAIDRSLGVSSVRRSFRAMTIQQDDLAVADRWAAAVRTVATLATLGWAASEVNQLGVAPLALLAIFAVVRSLWWRLSIPLVTVDAVVLVALITATPAQTEFTQVALTLLAGAVGLEAGFVAGLWRALLGAAVALGFVVGVWLGVLDRTLEQVLEPVTSAVLVVTAVATGAMARRIWQDGLHGRSGELRRFRSAMYELSRRQAVVAVSFDIGTVAHDSLQRVIADVRPRSAMMLVADGPGPLQVAATHNLDAPPPVRLTWQGGTHGSGRALASPGTSSVPGPRDGPPAQDDRHPEATTDDTAPDDTAADDTATPPGEATDEPTEEPTGADEQPTGRTGGLLQRMRVAGTSEAVDEDPAGSPDGGTATYASRGRRRHAAASDDPVHANGRRRADSMTQRRLADLLDRTTIEAVQEGRLTALLQQLAPSLASGTVWVNGAELDGELMGALIVVDPADTRSLARHAEETALALDSVRLFNRLRAFTRDQERARIGRSLHDGVMQTLAHVAFELDRAANDSGDESQVEHLGELRDHVLGTVDEMRAVVNDLRTVRLDRGLASALEAMGMTLSPAGGPVIEVSADEVGSLPGDVEEQFLRIAEEALTNAVRHSGARNVEVSLSREDGALVLQVSDDGRGFTQSRVGAVDGGVGLTSMYQRSRSIGARLDIDTGRDGTIITLNEPIASMEVVTDVPMGRGHEASPRRGRGRWGPR